MSQAFKIKRGDIRPKLEATLSDKNGAIDLTPASVVRFILRNEAGTVVVNSTSVTVVSAAAGTVQYQWVPADTATAGAHYGEFELEFTGPTDKQTFPTDGFIRVDIVQDIA